MDIKRRFVSVYCRRGNFSAYGHDVSAIEDPPGALSGKYFPVGAAESVHAVLAVLLESRSGRRARLRRRTDRADCSQTGVGVRVGTDPSRRLVRDGPGGRKRADELPSNQNQT